MGNPAVDGPISDLHGRCDTVEFLLGNSQPRTREDVMELMFRNGGPGMTAIENRNYGFAVEQVLRFACMVTQHDGDSTRFVQGIESWRDQHKFPFELGMATVSGRRMDPHGLVSIARRVSCNVPQKAPICQPYTKVPHYNLCFLKHKRFVVGHF